MMIRNLVRRSYGCSRWKSVIRPVFLAFCLTCFCGVDAEEQANQLNTEAPARDNSGGSGQKSSLLSRIRKNHRGTAVSERDSDYYLIVKSPDGRGSAFLVRLWEQPVIVTNAHVFLSMKDPEIVDINGRKYVPKEVLASKTRDLVIISYEGAEQEQRELLTAVGDAGAIPIDTGVVAYGNSLGDDVIVTQKGKLLGIGPDKIEVDAPFVPGNSGGPVVLDEGGEVIGVSTYLRILEPDRSTTGSKYEATKLKRQVRRFATRIDNLDPSDLEPVFLEKIGCERELVRRSSEWVSCISDTFKEDEAFTLERFQDFREECFRRCRVLIEGEAAEWSNTYLRNKFSENREMIEAVLKVLKLDFLVEISRIGVLLDEHASSLLSVKREGSPVRCFFCMGSGKNSIKKPNPLYRPKSAYARWVIERRKCPVCNGNGKRPLWSERICFTYPKELEDAAGRHIAEAGQTFCGFLLGGTEQQELARFVFYRKKPLYRIPNAFGETLVFAGNHFDRSATCTALTFMFGRLLCVEIVTPQLEKGGIREGLTRYLKEELSDSSPFYVQAIRIVDRKMIPLDLRGRPLLKPVKPQRMEDDPEYDGMIVRGVHSCFGAINALDLNSLAEKNRKAQNQ